MSRVPCTGGASKWPVYDRNGVRVCTGDKMRAQVCIGRYGQTEIVEFTVTEQHWQYCQHSALNFRGVYRAVGTSFNGTALRCWHQNHDFEHGHTTWAEVIH